jgi:RNA polymerase subunit RPABC4/transcription elongation factor Spt4
VETTRASIVCKYCGKHIPTTSAFCPYCDRALA